MVTRILITLAICLFGISRSSAQLGIANQGATATAIATSFVGPGITISNATINCASTGYSTFSNGNTTNIGLTNGILLTTGNANGVGGTNSSMATNPSTAHGGTCNDPQLASIEPTAGFDCCILEFDFVPSCDQFSVRFVFASEEYLEYVGSVNDAFGFFVTGPNPLGGNYTDQNIAVLPGGTPVSINTVNDVTNSGFYVDNPGSFFGSGTIRYDGFTTPITAQVNLVPCQTYHFKIAIADASDDIYDSGVFIDFFQCTNVMTATTVSTPATCGSNNGTATATVNNGFPAFTYNWAPAPGAGQGTPNATGLTAGTTYTVTVDDAYACIAPVTSTVTVGGTITPTVTVNSPTICTSGSTTLTASGATTYTWTPATGLSATTGASVTASPTVTTNYTVTGTTSGCSGSATSTVTVSPLTVSVNSATICTAGTATLTASGATTYTWTPATGLSATTGASVTASPTVTTNYTVTGTTGGCSGSVTSTVTVSSALAVAVNSPSICTAGTATLTASGATTYAWTPATGLSATTGATVTATPTITTNYTVTGTTGGCSGAATSIVTVNPLPTPTAGSDSPECVNGTINFTSGGGTGYAWAGPNAFVSGTQNPSLASVTTAMSGTYTVTVTDANSCVATATTAVVVNPLPTPTAGSDSPECVNGTINFTSGGGTGYSWAGPNAFTSLIDNPTLTSVTTAMSGDYTVTVTDGNGCTATATTSVTVNALPIATAGTDSPECEGGTLNFNSGGGTGYSWSGPNAFSSAIQNPVLTPVTAAMAGTYTVTVTDGNGCVDTEITVVVVNPLPTPTAGSDSPECVNGTITFNSSGGTGYSWAGPNAFTSAIQNPSLTSVTTAMSGTYTVTVTDANSCVATATTAVVVNVLPTPTAGSDAPECTGGTIVFNSTGGTGYSWAGPNSFSSLIDNPTLTSVTTAMSGTYTVTVTDGNGCVATATTSVTVNPGPIPTAGSDSPECVNGTVNLTAGGGTTYAWTGPNAFSSALQNPSLTTVTTAMSGTYSVTITDAATSCVATITTSVTVNALPTPTAGSDTPECTNGTINFTSSGGAGYSWSGPNAYSALIQNPSIVGVTTAMSGTYTVTVVDANTCIATATTTILVNPLPTVAIGSDSPECVNGTVNFTSGGGTSYSWAGPNAYSSGNQNPTLSTVTLAMGGTYTVTVTDVNSCVASGTTSLVINALPVVTINSNSPVCENNTINLSAGGGAIYSWSGPSGYTASGATPSISSATPAMAGNYTVTVQDVNGCPGANIVPVTIVVLPTPFAGSNGPVCAGDNLLLSLSQPYATYSWTGPNSFSSSTQNPNISGIAPTGSGTYSVTVTDNNSCAGSTTIPVVVNPLPTGTMAVIPSKCAPLCDTLSFIPTVNNIVLYSWDLGLGTINVNNDSIAHCFNNGGTYDVILSLTDANTCTNTITKNDWILVYENPVADFNYLPNPITVFEPTTTFYDYSTGPSAQSYNWEFWSTDLLGTSILASPTFTFPDVGVYDVTLSIASSQGCTSTVTKPVTVLEEFAVYIPNAFTPNGDGDNETFGPVGIGIDKLKYRLYIYDRWGEKLFESTELGKNWDGKKMGEDRIVMEDVYIYKFECRKINGEKFTKSGHVTLVK